MRENVRLFFDDRYFERSRGLSREWGRPTRHPQNPVLQGDRPWEFRCTCPSTVLYDPVEGCYKMWYTTHNDEWSTLRAGFTCYATSVDGITWEKPALGIIPYPDAPENNIVITGHFFATGHVIYDEEESDPSRRYKSLAYDVAVRAIDPDLADRFGRWEMMDRDTIQRVWDAAYSQGYVGAFASYSPDGIHWTPHDDVPTWYYMHPEGHWVGFGDTFSIHRDPRLNRYVAYTRCEDPKELEGSPSFRIIGRSETDDFESWPDPEVVLAPDADDPPALQHHHMPVIWYGDRYLGLLELFHSPPDDTRCDTQLAWSDDGIHWIRHPERAVFLPLEPAPAWDYGIVYGLKTLVLEEEIRFYYYGVNAIHNPPEGIRYGQIVDGHRRQSAIGLARLRLDGFVSLAADSSGGELLTTPMTAPEGRFFLNVDATDGWVAAEVVDIFGRPLPDYTFWDCVPMRGVDGTRLELTWKCGKPIAVTGRRTVRLRLYLENARLYAIRYA